MDEARKRYLSDATYHAAVDCMVKWLKDGFLTQLELRNAASLACIVDYETTARETFGRWPAPAPDAKEVHHG